MRRITHWNFTDTAELDAREDVIDGDVATLDDGSIYVRVDSIWVQRDAGDIVRASGSFDDDMDVEVPIATVSVHGAAFLRLLLRNVTADANRFSVTRLAFQGDGTTASDDDDTTAGAPNAFNSVGVSYGFSGSDIVLTLTGLGSGDPFFYSLEAYRLPLQ